MLELLIKARKANIGPGMEVNRILPFRLRRMVGPFIFMDHAGPLRFGEGSATPSDVLPHPHIGLSTVTYLFSGNVTHRDSLGVEQKILPGEVNWMTAGSGITHSERFEDPSLLQGGSLEMLQTWVALPEKWEESSPAFTNYKPSQLPLFTAEGLRGRIIAGEAYGLKSTVSTHSPLFYIHLDLETGAGFTLPQGYAERAVYITRGAISFAHARYEKGDLLVFRKNSEPVLKALEKTTVMLLGGEPLGERFIWWNFVSSRKERIDQAKADWKAGRMLLPPSDNHEFVPLPEEKNRQSGDPPPQPLS
jgi:redox-sensitive bicupin YhaK (pirin superfamily)